MRSVAVSISALVCLAGPPVAAQDYGYILFQTPSANIQCGMFDGEFSGVRCDMFELDPSYTKPPPDCEFDWGSSFYIGAGEPMGELACVSDALGNPPFQTLQYGARIEYGGVSCLSERTGLTCTNATGHGFTLSRARQRLY